MKPFLAVPVLDQDFDLTLGIFQDFQATFGQANTLFKDFQRFVERQVAFFQFTDDRFQPCHRLFEFDPAHGRSCPFLKGDSPLYRPCRVIYTKGSGRTRLTVQWSWPCDNRARISSSVWTSSAFFKMTPSR